MKKILVPTDFSECATNASEYAIKLAKLGNVEVIFLHIMAIPIDWIHLNHNQEKLYPDITKKVHKTQSKLNEWTEKAEKQGVVAHSYLHYNENHQDIIKSAQDNDCDLIVMGYQGIDSFSDLFVGSNTLRVVRISEIPVLVINKPIQKVKNVAFISTFESEYYVLRGYIADFIELTNYKLHLVYINTPLSFLDSGTVQNRIAKFKKNLELTAKSSIHNDYAFETGINNFCERNNIDLVITATHHKTGINRFVSGSLTENMIHQLYVPVLGIPLLENQIEN